MKCLAQSPRGRQGSVLFIVIALLAVMCLLIAINAQTLYTLKRELMLIDKQQRQHWTRTMPAENQQKPAD